MSVIAGTKKESVINKAREVLREKEIPYTIKRTKTWFWVSSTKPGAAQTALREAGLEMNPIITMHSVWCTKCNAISKFEKSKGKTWKCQKCGAKISVVNPSKVKAMVHPEALESLARYKDDLKAGHTSAAEYWRGQAGAYFTANPRAVTVLNKETIRWIWKNMYNRPYTRKEITSFRNQLTKREKLMGEIIRLEQDGTVTFTKYNPLTKSEKREITNLANTQFAISRKYSDDPVRSSFWYGRSVGMGKIAKMFNPQAGCPICGHRVIFIRKKYKKDFPLGSAYLCQHCNSIFNVSGEKIAKTLKYPPYFEMVNPKVKKWDPISEILQDDEEEDNMIGAEINPLSTRQRERVVAKYPAQLEAVKRATIGLIGDRVKTIDSSRLYARTVDQARRLGENAPSWALFVELVRFIGGKFSKTDKKIIIILPARKNPLAAIGSAAITGVGLGIGFKSVDWMVKKIKKNPRRR